MQCERASTGLMLLSPCGVGTSCQACVRYAITATGNRTDTMQAPNHTNLSCILAQLLVTVWSCHKIYFNTFVSRLLVQLLASSRMELIQALPQYIYVTSASAATCSHVERIQVLLQYVYVAYASVASCCLVELKALIHCVCVM